MAIVLTTGKRVEFDGVAFQVGPENFGAFLASMAKADELAAAFEMGKAARDLASTHLDLINRIESWEGIVDENGEPAPCTMKSRLVLFGMRPDLLVKLSRAVAGLEEEERGKSEAPQGGSQGTTPEPATPAGDS